MTDFLCPFCGSTERLIKTGTISLKRSGKFEPDTTTCCKAQSKNMEYGKKRYGAGAPPIDEISKL